MPKAGTVLRVGSITANFQSESPLHPAARAFLAEAFDRGWADPKKRQQESRQAAILLNEAKETFAGHLGVRSDQLYFLGDPALGFHLGISGLLTPQSTLFYPAVSRSEVFAVASTAVASLKLPVNLQGEISYPRGQVGDVLAWQTVNGETGIIGAQPDDFQGHIFVDATSNRELLPLPKNWQTALWNSRAWQGPAGLGLLAISDRSEWKNPLPHLDQNVGSSEFSLPLVVASALALDAHVGAFSQRSSHLAEINNFIRNYLKKEIPDVDIAGEIETTISSQLSFSFLYVDAEQLVDKLNVHGFSVDSGSACNSSNLESSHVLVAMGLLSHGNIRITLREEITIEKTEEFLHTLKELVADLRS